MLGENIRFKLRVANKGNSEIDSMTLKLVRKAQLSTYNMTTNAIFNTSSNKLHVKLDTDVMKIGNIPKTIKAGAEEDWEGEMKIPDFCSPSINNLTSIIQMNYFFVFEPERDNGESSLTIPIVIGFVPFRDNETSFIYPESLATAPPYHPPRY